MIHMQTGFNPEYSEEEITKEQLTDIEGNAVLEFGTPWCSHCKAARPLLEEVLNDYSDVPHIKVLDGKGKSLGRTYQVKLWPTLIYLQDGKEVARLVRPDSVSEIRDMLES